MNKDAIKVDGMTMNDLTGSGQISITFRATLPTARFSGTLIADPKELDEYKISELAKATGDLLLKGLTEPEATPTTTEEPKEAEQTA